jgi:hypothetical protein
VRFTARKQWLSSTRYRRYLKAHLAAWLRWIPLQWLHPTGRALWGVAEGELATLEYALEPLDRREPFFSRPWCVLIGPGTFSSALMLANAVGDLALAPLFGEPTGTAPNAFGEVYSCDLTHSRLSLGVSSAYYVRSNGDGEDPRPVLPTRPLVLDPADARAGRDTALEAARA